MPLACLVERAAGQTGSDDGPRNVEEQCVLRPTAFAVVRHFAVLVLVSGAVSVGGLHGVASAAAVKECRKAQAALVQNGKRTCVAAARFRQGATPPPSATASMVARAMSGGPISLRQKNGTAVPRTLPTALVNDVARNYAAGEEQLVSSLRAALPRSGNARASELKLTEGNLTKSADGSSATASMGFGGTAAGHAVSGTIEMRSTASGRFDVGFDVTVADPTGATKSNGFTARDIARRGQECPTPDGRFAASSAYDTSSRSAETFGSKNVKLGAIRESTTSSATSSGSVQFGADGKAQPFRFTVSASYDSARSAQALVFSSRTRAVGTGSMTGTIDPATGQVSGAVVTVSARTSGYEQGQAKADAELRAAMEKLLKEELGRLLDKVRDAQAGCTGPFEVTIALKTDANFASHSASGTINATLTATKTSPGVFTGSVPVRYDNLAFVSKSACTFLNPVASPATFTATITVGADGFLQVKRSAGDGSANAMVTTATTQCPGDPLPPPVSGQPGPRLMMPGPTEFALPAAGGDHAIGGGFQDGAEGWTHTGKITVKRAP